MIRLNTFTLSTIQNFLQLMNEFEQNGVTDVRFVRERLEDHIRANMMDRRKSKTAAGRKVKLYSKSQVRCPECGNPLQSLAVDSEKILACPRCRWSKMAEGI